MPSPSPLSWSRKIGVTRPLRVVVSTPCFADSSLSCPPPPPPRLVGFCPLLRGRPGRGLSGDETPECLCKITPVILHGVVSPEFTPQGLSVMCTTNHSLLERNFIYERKYLPRIYLESRIGSGSAGPYLELSPAELVRATKKRAGKLSQRRRVYRGTSLIRNSPPP